MSNYGPYGKCPKCGEIGVARERRLNGNDVCKNGHQYPSKDAIDEAADAQVDVEILVTPPVGKTLRAFTASMKWHEAKKLIAHATEGKAFK